MFRKIIKNLLAIVECSRGPVGYCVVLINSSEVNAKVEGSTPSESILAIGSKFERRNAALFHFLLKVFAF